MVFVPKQDIRRAAGRAIVCGFDGTTVTAELKEILREVRPVGLVLFARNIQSPQQLAELGAELKALRAGDPLLLCVDQEGGRVARVRAPATEWPAMGAVGELDHVDTAQRVGEALGRELRAMNIDVNFAPVVDVDSNPDNPVIGDRSLSSDPAIVGRLGAALVKGLQTTGVAACAKHFPGHGDTDVDSHIELPTLSHDVDRLRAVEWPPFADAIAAGVGAIMTAHVVIEAIDSERPGTLSPQVLGHLRQELGFEGVVVSDDIEMKALADRYTPSEIAVQGMAAGLDLFLPCHDPAVVFDLYRGLVQGVEQERITQRRLLEAERRVVNWRERFYRAPVAAAELRRWVGCEEHRLLAQRLGAGEVGA